MRKILASILYVAAGVVVLVDIALGLMAYFVVSVGPGGVVYDGLGRVVKPVPALVAIFLRERDWPGLGWFIADIAVFWITIGIAYGLFKLAGLLLESGEKESGSL